MRRELNTTVNNVRMLNYDCLIQLTLIGKLFFFYLIVGINTNPAYRYGVIAFCVTYYLYMVREIVAQHYED